MHCSQHDDSEIECLKCFGCAQMNNISVGGATVKEQVIEIQ